MLNPYDPTDDELRQWAQSEAFAPVEDFDLMIADLDRVPLLVELASSPARVFFLSCLYLVVGDAVRTSFQTATRSDVEAALTHAAAIAEDDPAIRKWIADSRRLLASPEEFDYEAWCDGGLARSAAAEAPGRSATDEE
jgi:hypothetical protein